MLTVEQIKKIFDNFEIEAFRLDLLGEKQGEYGIVVLNDNSTTNGECYQFEADGKRLTANSYVYYHFLDRVCQAINIKTWNKYYLQVDDIGVHYVTYPDLKIEETWILSAYDMSVDKCREKAIIYILDLIGSING